MTFKRLALLALAATALATPALAEKVQIDPAYNTVSIGALTATSTDASGTVTAGGTYQTVFASNTSRKGCLVQNPSTATEVLSVKVGTMASAFTIPAGGSFSCQSGSLVVTDAITLTAATTAHAFTAVSQ